MKSSNPAIGHSWEEVEAEFMSCLTPKEKAKIDANVEALGRLLDARDAGRISGRQFNAAFDRLNRSVGARRRRSAVRTRIPKVAL